MPVECYDKSIHTEQYWFFPHQPWKGPLALIGQVGSMSHLGRIQTSSNEQCHVIASFKEAPDSEAWGHCCSALGLISTAETPVLMKQICSSRQQRWHPLLDQEVAGFYCCIFAFNYCYCFKVQRNVLPLFIFFYQFYINTVTIIREDRGKLLSGSHV